MKTWRPSTLFALLLVGLTSCEGRLDLSGDGLCGGEDIEICQDHELKDHENVPAIYEQHIEKELVKDESCGCIVSGLIRYTRGGDTVAYVDYGDGDCDPTVIVSVGDFDKKSGDFKKVDQDCCQFLQDCGNNTL